MTHTSDITVYAACDTKYFIEHSKAFTKSALKNNHTVVIDIFYNFEEDVNIQTKNLMKFLTDEFYKDGITSKNTKVEIINYQNFLQAKQKLKVLQNNAFYASFRFLALSSHVFYEKEVNNKRLVTLDIDCVINKEIKIDGTVDLGLFIRNSDPTPLDSYEQEGMRIAAGIVYVSHRAHEYLLTLEDEIIRKNIQWFSDQVALWEAFQYHQTADYNVLNFNDGTGWLDWEFDNPNAIIYTGKGPRKHSDKKYLKIKKEFETLILE